MRKIITTIDREVVLTSGKSVRLKRYSPNRLHTMDTIDTIRRLVGLPLHTFVVCVDTTVKVCPSHQAGKLTPDLVQVFPSFRAFLRLFCLARPWALTSREPLFNCFRATIVSISSRGLGACSAPNTLALGLIVSFLW